MTREILLEPIEKIMENGWKDIIARQELAMIKNLVM